PPTRKLGLPTLAIKAKERCPRSWLARSIASRTPNIWNRVKPSWILSRAPLPLLCLRSARRPEQTRMHLSPPLLLFSRRLSRKISRRPRRKASQPQNLWKRLHQSAQQR
ncbi:hypothetical protein FRC01_005084, partial [Tulasnella sp. 417]